MASVLLVFQMGQPRIWMSMSRDGLLPKRFSRVHPKFQTPSYATIVTGFVVAVPALFLNLTMVTDLCSIGTLFAFVLVCAGVLVLQNKPNISRGKFKTPYVNSKYIFPLLMVVGLVFALTKFKQETMDFVFNEKQIKAPTEFITTIGEDGTKKVYNFLLEKNIAQDQSTDLEELMSKYYEKESQYKAIMDSLPVTENQKYESGFSLFKHKIPMWIFLFSLLGLMVWSWKQNLSLIPLLGLICCLYMMSQLSIWNWIYFTCWLLIGLIIYFGFSHKNSKLNTVN
jgi:APA family basic amino acid/polyamine antiporter